MRRPAKRSSATDRLRTEPLTCYRGRVTIIEHYASQRLMAPRTPIPCLCACRCDSGAVSSGDEGALGPPSGPCLPWYLIRALLLIGPDRLFSGPLAISLARDGPGTPGSRPEGRRRLVGSGSGAPVDSGCRRRTQSLPGGSSTPPLLPRRRTPTPGRPTGALNCPVDSSSAPAICQRRRSRRVQRFRATYPPEPHGRAPWNRWGVHASAGQYFASARGAVVIWIDLQPRRTLPGLNLPRAATAVQATLCRRTSQHVACRRCGDHWGVVHPAVPAEPLLP